MIGMEVLAKWETVADAILNQAETDSKSLLIQRSRTFKQSATEVRIHERLERITSLQETRRAVAPLLKAFQAEIDALAVRSRHAETAFLDMYRCVVAQPPVADDLPALRVKADKVDNLQIEVDTLRDTLHQYNQEISSVKNQEV